MGECKHQRVSIRNDAGDRTAEYLQCADCGSIFQFNRVPKNPLGAIEQQLAGIVSMLRDINENIRSLKQTTR